VKSGPPEQHRTPSTSSSSSSRSANAGSLDLHFLRSRLGGGLLLRCFARHSPPPPTRTSSSIPALLLRDGQGNPLAKSGLVGFGTVGVLELFFVFGLFNVSSACATSVRLVQRQFGWFTFCSARSIFFIFGASHSPLSLLVTDPLVFSGNVDSASVSSSSSTTSSWAFRSASAQSPLYVPPRSHRRPRAPRSTQVRRDVAVDNRCAVPQLFV
jgi:hypothetical protein